MALLTEWIVSLPTWTIIRVSGLVSYGLLFVGICLGILYSLPYRRSRTKALVYRLHTVTLGAGFFIGVGHAMLLVVDAYMPFGWKELLVPFAAANAPLWNGLGTLAEYGMLVVFLTTDLKNVLGRRWWRMLHMLAYPVFIMALLHGIGVGTDTPSRAVQALYGASAAIVLALTVYRAGAAGRSKPQRMNA
ncbi:ferric reductase [Paenibacillus sp. CC-CFT747]|nr:ferric reductase [Paenibacillus sp. CC-CFT747]